MCYLIMRPLPIRKNRKIKNKNKKLRYKNNPNYILVQYTKIYCWVQMATQCSYKYTHNPTHTHLFPLFTVLKVIQSH